MTKHVSGTLSEEGCFDSLELLDLESNTVVALILDVNYYRDVEVLEKRVHLRGKCQLAELPSTGVSWETDGNGFVIKTSSKQTQIEYRYDDQGHPLSETMKSNDKTSSTSATSSTDSIKRSDYTAATLLNN